MFKNFDYIANLKYGISKKSDGAMELAAPDLTRDENRRNFFNRQGINCLKTVSPMLIHSEAVVKVNNNHRGKIIPDADGLVTASRDLFLTVTVADCFGIYFFDPASNILGLTHSGWRGTAGNIAGQTVKTISKNPAKIIVGIGPGIGPCHFEIKADVLEKFALYPESVINRAGKIFIDLPMIIKEQLTAAGIKNENIESCSECTFCLKEKYFSFRRDKPKNIEAMIAYIGMV